MQLKKLRNRFHVSQPVFATYLNTTPKTIQQREQGDRKPNSIALFRRFKHALWVEWIWRFFAVIHQNLRKVWWITAESA